MLFDTGRVMTYRITGIAGDSPTCSFTPVVQKLILRRDGRFMGNNLFQLLSYCDHLTEVVIDGFISMNRTKWPIELLKKNKLQVLKVRLVDMDIRHLEHINTGEFYKALGCCTSLIDIDLSVSSLVDGDLLTFFNGLRGNKNLKRLRLCVIRDVVVTYGVYATTTPEISDSDWKSLTEYLGNKECTLETLELSRIRSKEEHIKQLAECLTKNKTLTKFKWTITSNPMKVVKRFTRLVCQNNTIEDIAINLSDTLSGLFRVGAWNEFRNRADLLRKLTQYNVAIRSVKRKTSGVSIKSNTVREQMENYHLVLDNSDVIDPLPIELRNMLMVAQLKAWKKDLGLRKDDAELMSRLPHFNGVLFDEKVRPRRAGESKSRIVRFVKSGESRPDVPTVRCDQTNEKVMIISSYIGTYVIEEWMFDTWCDQ